MSHTEEKASGTECAAGSQFGTSARADGDFQPRTFDDAFGPTLGFAPIGVSFFTRREQQSVVIRKSEHGFVVVILCGRIVGCETGRPFLIEQSGELVAGTGRCLRRLQRRVTFGFDFDAIEFVRRFLLRFDAVEYVAFDFDLDAVEFVLDDLWRGTRFRC